MTEKTFDRLILDVRNCEAILHGAEDRLKATNADYSRLSTADNLFAPGGPFEEYTRLLDTRSNLQNDVWTAESNLADAKIALADYVLAKHERQLVDLSEMDVSTGPYEIWPKGWGRPNGDALETGWSGSAVASYLTLGNHQPGNYYIAVGDRVLDGDLWLEHYEEGHEPLLSDTPDANEQPQPADA